VLAFVRDITERKRAMAMLHENEVAYRLMVETAQEGVWMLDAEARTRFTNIRMEDMLGYTEQEMAGRSLFDFMDETARLEAERLFEQRRQGINEKHDFRFRRKDGSDLWAIVSTSPTFDAEGCFTGALGIITDITERRRVEEALRESEQRFSQIFNTIVDVLFLITVEPEDCFRFEAVNPAFLSSKGLTEEQVVGKRMEEVLPRTAHAQVLGNYKQAVCENKTVRWEEVSAYPTGTLYGLVTVTPSRSADGNCTHLIGSVHDITEIRRTEKAMEQLVKQKEILMKELQHRVKNSLILVSGLLGLELANLSDARAKEIFINTQSRILSMMSIYEQLYSSSEVDHVDLRFYIKNLSDLLLKTYVKGTGNILFKTRLDEIKLDTKRALPLGLILNELITNSLKHAYPSGGKGEIRIDLKKTDHHITLDVADDGVGWPKGIDPESANSMGLNMVRMLAKQIKGEVTIQRKKGASVLISFKA
jgi:PAS domain S-box-containing protein